MQTRTGIGFDAHRFEQGRFFFALGNRVAAAGVERASSGEHCQVRGLTRDGNELLLDILVQLRHGCHKSYRIGVARAVIDIICRSFLG